MLKQIANLFGSSNEGSIKKIRPLVEKINSIETSLTTVPTEKLTDKSNDLKSKLLDGKSMDDDEIIADAFALVREAAKRTLNQRHFDVQLMGGMVLHQGKIAEMKTGEGKTLVSTLAAYLNAINGKGVHIITVNDYLAKRDAQWMGAIYRTLGLSVGVLQHDESSIYTGKNLEAISNNLETSTRKDAYQCDITYGTNNEFGFDYLRDNMLTDETQRVQRSLEYAIIDEVDNILIDEARTPLIISGPAADSSKDYYKFARLVPNLSHLTDFTIDQKHRTVSLSMDGISKLEKLLGINNLYSPDNYEVVAFVENALKANTVFEKDKEYVVKNGQVVIVDEFTGRLMEGRRYSDGLHQAIEAKEGLKVQQETITYANITLQNYFRMYKKLSGMTGTAITESEEFWKIYKLDVVEIPTNKPMLRNDSTDLIYTDKKIKYKAIINDVIERNKLGQPILIGTTDISKSELISNMLKRSGIKHEVLNAKQHEKEAVIVAQAGSIGSVTVATNMAGRGTDIVLGGNPETLKLQQEAWQKDHDNILSLGGLHIIGTERHEARRIDNQLRGPAGRQGDPGSYQFYVALDDDLMNRFGGDKVKSLMHMAGVDENTPIQNKMVSKSIQSAQVKVEAFHFDMRKHLVEYDDVINTHREIIYKERDKVLDKTNLRPNIESMLSKEIQNILDSESPTPELPESNNPIYDSIINIFPKDIIVSNQTINQMSKSEIETYFEENIEQIYDKFETQHSSGLIRALEQNLMLRVLDNHWVNHLTSMESLRQGIGLQAFGQRDPLVAYKREGHSKFQELLDKIQHDVAYMLFNINIVKNNPVANPINTSSQQSPSSSINSTNKSQTATKLKTSKIGRNSICPCGSGKKYKKCHGE